MSDLAWMRRALALAATMAGKTAPNPSVGCVLVANDAAIAEGATGEGGRPHAEEIALSAAGGRARGATAYLTLEPCARRSSGAPSCAELLRDAGAARIVIAARDPHPFAAGKGIELLRAAGVEIVIGLLEAEARTQNEAFFAAWKPEP